MTDPQLQVRFLERREIDDRLPVDAPGIDGARVGDVVTILLRISLEHVSADRMYVGILKSIEGDAFLATFEIDSLIEPARTSRLDLLLAPSQILAIERPSGN